MSKIMFNRAGMFVTLNFMSFTFGTEPRSSGFTLTLNLVLTALKIDHTI